MHYVIAYFAKKGGGTMAIFTYYLMNSEKYSALWANLWAIFMYFYASIHTLLGDFEYTKAVTLHCG